MQKKSAWRKRLTQAIAPCALLCFMYIVWGPMEVFTANAANFRFTYAQALWPLALLSVSAAALLSALLAALPRRAFRAAMSLLLALALASYVQNQFLNLDLGLLEGQEIDWSAYGNHSWINLSIWIALLILIPVLLHFVKKRMRVIVGVSLFLLTVQVLTFGIVSAQYLLDPDSGKKDPVYILNGEEQYHVSTQGNVVVFLLDYFSNDYIDSALKDYPDMLDAFQDFTYYNNCDPGYIGTFPSVVHMLTGEEFDNTISVDAWFARAWQSDKAKSFYQALSNAGYQFHFFDSSNNYFGIQYAQPYVQNLVRLDNDTYTVRYPRLIERMLTLSLYRYVPHVFKQHFYLSSADFYGTVGIGEQDIVTCYNRNAYYNVLRGTRLQPIADDGKYFTIQFLRGTHPPYHLDENAVYDESATLEQCAAGYMRIVAEYIAQLKALGLYDEATIIITSDHGDKENHMQVIYFIKEPYAAQEQLVTSTAPISHCEFLGTILQNIGADSSGFSTIYDFADGEKRERTVMRNYIDAAYPAVPKYRGTGTGTHTVMYAYTYTGDRKELLKQVRRGPTEILPLTESFN